MIKGALMDAMIKNAASNSTVRKRNPSLVPVEAPYDPKANTLASARRQARKEGVTGFKHGGRMHTSETVTEMKRRAPAAKPMYNKI